MRNLLSIGVLLVLVACGTPTQTPSIEEKLKDSMVVEETLVSTDYKTPVWGKRLEIIGDFDGDQKLDTLKEHFIINGKEAPKSYEEIKAYEEHVDYVMVNNAVVSLKAKGFTDIRCEGMCLGILLVENVGDLDKDGKDEIGVVLDAADFSNLNSYRIYSYHNEEWKERLQFNFHEVAYADNELHKDKMVTIDDQGNWKVKKYSFEMGEFVEKDTILSNLEK